MIQLEQADLFQRCYGSLALILVTSHCRPGASHHKSTNNITNLYPSQYETYCISAAAARQKPRNSSFSSMDHTKASRVLRYLRSTDMTDKSTSINKIHHSWTGRLSVGTTMFVFTTDKTETCLSHSTIHGYKRRILLHTLFCSSAHLSLRPSLQKHILFILIATEKPASKCAPPLFSPSFSFALRHTLISQMSRAKASLTMLIPTMYIYYPAIPPTRALMLFWLRTPRVLAFTSSNRPADARLLIDRSRKGLSPLPVHRLVPILQGMSLRRDTKSRGN